MRLSPVFSSCVLLCSLVALSSRVDATTYTIHFGNSGPSPSSLDVKVGDVINWDGSFAYLHSITLTDPNGARSLILDHSCPGDIVSSVTVTLAGTYSYVDTVNVASNTYQSFAGGFVATSSLSVTNDKRYSGLSITLASPTNGAGTVRLRSDNAFDLHLSLYDATGVMVHDYQPIEVGASEVLMPLSCESLASGQYYLRAMSEEVPVAMTKVLIVR